MGNDFYRIFIRRNRFFLSFATSHLVPFLFTAVKIHLCPSHGVSVPAARKLNVRLKDARVMLCVLRVTRNT